MASAKSQCHSLFLYVLHIYSTITPGNTYLEKGLINPYSKNKEAALKVLELLASDYFKYTGTSFSGFVYEDKDMYPERYHPDSEIFNDFLNIINSNNKIAYYTFSVQRLDIDDYQAGKLTLEEAVAEYQRQVDIWLNE